MLACCGLLGPAGPPGTLLLPPRTAPSHCLLLPPVSPPLRQALSAADYVVEAVPEAEALKRQVFQALDELAPAHAILASNTSSIAITRLAAATQRPDRVVGLHFMNPVRGWAGKAWH